MRRGVAVGASGQRRTWGPIDESPTVPLAFARRHAMRFERDLEDFVRFPTVSAQPRYSAQLRSCAAWLASRLRRAGLERTRVHPGRRHPIVQADWRGAPGRPTVLVYGHYDVQPVDPIGDWRTPPFEPTRRGPDLFGRGASDDKGQLLAQVAAIESWLRGMGALPVNVHCLFEGEEEIGSSTLRPFVRRHRVALACDAVAISDTRMLGPERPAITYALRGSLSAELRLMGPPRDLHSGAFGGVVRNPAQALAEVLARLHDRHGRVAIPGFYERVERLSPAQRDAIRQSGPTDREILASAGVGVGFGEHGFTLLERATIRPALTINGLTSGYQGPGSKGVIPSSASAKLGFRLVRNQDPAEVQQQLRDHLARLIPPTVSWRLEVGSAAPPVVIDARHPAVQAAMRAYRAGFGAEPVLVRSGGTIPVVHTFGEALAAPVVLMGFALPDDGMHAPNEKFHLPNLHKGIATYIHFLAEMGRRG
jgi:acetylornithine deacetylase/succinyl-diaminopimelate desuccinylase-like protein